PYTTLFRSPRFERWYGNVELCGCLVDRTAAQPDGGQRQCLCISEGFKFFEPGRNGLHTINIAYVLGVRTVIAADLLGNGVNPGNYGSVSGLFIGVMDIEVKCGMWWLPPERGIRRSSGLDVVMVDGKEYGEHRCLLIGVINNEDKCEMWCLTPERGIRISRGLHGVMFDWKKYGEHAVDLR